jgi:CheY-like chemotaxis protein
LLVAISGYGRDVDRMRARDAGFDLYLTKPIDSRALAEVLGRAV